jgi:hypothetical protein
VLFSYRIRQCVCSSTIRFVPCAFFINKQFRTCAYAFPNKFTVRSYAYCAGKHWILYWIQENKTATYFLRSRLFTHDIMKSSTAISIKHRILATFNIKKKSILTTCMPLNNCCDNLCPIPFANILSKENMYNSTLVQYVQHSLVKWFAELLSGINIDMSNRTSVL